MNEQELNDTFFLHHLAELSFYKLNQSSQNPHTEPTLRRQLFVRNLLLVSSNLIITSQSIQEEQVWLDACFDELVEDEDMEQEQEKPNENDDKKNCLVVALPFKYMSHEKDQQQTKGALFVL